MKFLTRSLFIACVTASGIGGGWLGLQWMNHRLSSGHAVHIATPAAGAIAGSTASMLGIWGVSGLMAVRNRKLKDAEFAAIEAAVGEEIETWGISSDNRLLVTEGLRKARQNRSPKNQ